MSIKPVNLFISYSHKDRAIKDALSSQLRVLEPEGLIKVWDDTAIDLGTKWEEEIAEALREAHIALLFISADFLTRSLSRRSCVILERIGHSSWRPSRSGRRLERS